MYSLVLMMALGNGASAPSFENDSLRPEPTPMAAHEHKQQRGRRGCHGGRGGCNGGGCWGGGYGCWGSGGYGCSGGGYGCSGGGYGGCHGGYGWYGGGGGYYGSPYVYYSPGYWGGNAYGSGSYGNMTSYGAPNGANTYYGNTPNAPMPNDSGFDQNRNFQDRNQPAGNPKFQDRSANPELGTSPRQPSDATNAASRLEGRGPAPATLVVSLPADAKLFVDGAPTRSTSDQRTFISPPIEPNRDFHYTLKAEMVRDGRTVTTTKDVTVRAGQETNIMLTLPSGDQSAK